MTALPRPDRPIRTEITPAHRGERWRFLVLALGAITLDRLLFGTDPPANGWDVFWLALTGVAVLVYGWFAVTLTRCDAVIKGVLAAIFLTRAGWIVLGPTDPHGGFPPWVLNEFLERLFRFGGSCIAMLILIRCISFVAARTRP